MVSERSYATTTSIGEELEIIQSTSTLIKTGENGGPTGLLLVAMRELDMSVGQRCIGFGELLQSNDGYFDRSTWP